MGVPWPTPAAVGRGEGRVSARQPALCRATFEPATGGYSGDAFPQPGERVRRLAHYLFLICSISARAGMFVKAPGVAQICFARRRKDTKKAVRADRPLSPSSVRPNAIWEREEIGRAHV